MSIFSLQRVQSFPVSGLPLFSLETLLSNMTYSLWRHAYEIPLVNNCFFVDCKLRIRRCTMRARGRLRQFKSLTSDKLMSHWKLLTPAAWKSRVTKLASVAFSADHICPTQTLPTKLITGSGSRAQDIAAALQRFPIETNRQWKHVFSALPSASRIDIEMVLTTVF